MMRRPPNAMHVEPGTFVRERVSLSINRRVSYAESFKQSRQFVQWRFLTTPRVENFVRFKGATT